MRFLLGTWAGGKPRPQPRPEQGCCVHCGEKVYPTPDAHVHEPGACRLCFDDAVSNYSVNLDPE